MNFRAAVIMLILLASLALQTGFSFLEAGPVAAATVDEFGIQQLYPVLPGSTSWNSLHWDNGRARELSSVRDRDPDDPTHWSMKRGRGSVMFDGNGTMTLSGPQARMYLSYLGPDDLPDKFWKNVEATVYYQRVKDNATNWGGIVIGTRSGLDGHTTGSACTASTYYARIRHDGQMDFRKELEHPKSQLRESRHIWGGDPLPFNQWIGMKFVIRNVDNDQHVKLELYRDLTEGANGGTWEKLGEYTDFGGWDPSHDCSFESDQIITNGGGVVFIRNTGVEVANYKWFSVREIAASTVNEFGIQQLYPVSPGSTSWNSLHWGNGRARELSSVRDRDPDDPTHWSMKRGRGSVMFDGNGTMTLSGPQPRMYLSYLGPDDRPNKFWKNVEATVYYQRVKDDLTNWGGIVIGTRSGHDGHTTGSACTASTYYARIRHDGQMDFRKELEHPKSQLRESRHIWGGDPLPFNQWIGMKFVIRNVDNDQHVKLELYRDLTEGANGGTWEKLGEYTDVGGWDPPHDCSFESDQIITNGGGVVFIRNTGVEVANYKWFSVREIAASSD